MVINSLLLILRDALPLFIFLALLLRLGMLSKAGCSLALGMSITALALLLNYSATVGQWWDGFGLDIIKALLLCLLLPGLLLFVVLATADKPPARTGDEGNRNASAQNPTTSQGQHKVLTLLVVPCIICFIAIPNLLDYSFYVYGYWQSANINSGFVSGLIMGLGISQSVATLLYLAFINNKSRLVLPALLFLFTAGQIADASTLLEQINWLDYGDRLWDTSFILPEDNEYGQLFHTLLGYEAAPTANYLLFYIVAFTLPFVLLQLRNRQRQWPEYRHV